MTGDKRAMGMADYNDSFLVYLGSDAFKNTSSVYRIAAQVHEIGNKIYQQFATYGLKKPEVQSDFLRNRDSDAGMALEECVFNGFVNPNGKVVR